MSEFLLYSDRDEIEKRIMARVKFILSPYAEELIRCMKTNPRWTVNHCWVYEGHCDGKGYRKISIMGNSYYVHRILYILSGRSPHLKPRHDLDHLCKNRSCCNPLHLQPMTRLAHNRKTHRKSKCQKGKPPAREENQQAPLTMMTLSSPQDFLQT